MKNNLEIYFHLGLPKVASTYFQNVIFPNLSDIRFFPKHQFNHYKDVAHGEEGGKYLFSIEKDKRLLETVEEILSHVPNAKIILFVRKQEDWIISRYKYHIRKHGGYSFQEFFDIDSDESVWKREDLIWREKIEKIEDLCQAPPLVLNFDDLKNDPETFINKVAAFTGTSLKSKGRMNKKVLKAFNEKQLIILRKFNQRFQYRPAKTSKPTLNKTHRKYREFLLHILSFISHLVPGFLIRKKSLFTEKDNLDFQRIREYYIEDWEFCEKYASTVRAK
jgi:hypothetical protein